MLAFSLFLLLAFDNVFSDCDVFDKTNITYVKSGYNGENFPAKYLEPDEPPTRDDFVFFLNAMYRTAAYFNRIPNDTDYNGCLGLFLMRATLKRTLLEYGDKIENPNKRMILDTIEMADNVLTHFSYFLKMYRELDWSDYMFRMVMLLDNDDVMVNTIGDFTEGKLKKWLFSDFYVSQNAKTMDEATLDRYDYCDILHNLGDDFPSAEESDYCLARIPFMHVPQPDAPFRWCGEEPHCRPWLSTPPSNGYSLTHRLLGILLRHVTRRCYLESKEVDDAHMDMLCAAMYREAVYVARRGFFARDIFLEHVSFCAYRGHLEVNRVNWYRKIASWVDDQGCVNETANTWRRRIASSKALRPDDEEHIKKNDKKLKAKLNTICEPHSIAVMTGTMATAVRYVLYYLYQSK